MWQFRAQTPSADFAQTHHVGHTFKEGPSFTVKTGLGEFPSEVVARVDGPRPMVHESRVPSGERLLEKETVDRELMHRLHGDMRKAMEEMRETQAATLAALSNLQTTLIRWIIFTGLVLIVAQMLF